MQTLNETEKHYVKEVVDQIIEDGGTVLMITRFGSHLYGTNTPNSDSDFMVLYLPDLKKAAAGVKAKSYRSGTNLKNVKNSAWDVDVQGLDIREVVRKFTKGEIVALDLMFAPTNKKATVFLHSRFRKFLDNYIYTGILRPYGVAGVVGYINQQAQKYGVKGTRLGQVIALRDFVSDKFDWDDKVSSVMEALKKRQDILDGDFIKFNVVAVTKKGGVVEDDLALDVLGKTALPTSTVKQLLDMLDKHIEKYGHRAKQALENKGIDWKAISHAFRAIYEYTQLTTQGAVEFPLPTKLAERLVELKNGSLDFKEVQKELEVALAGVRTVDLGERVPGDTVIEAIFSLWVPPVSEDDVDNFIATASREEVDAALAVGVENYLGKLSTIDQEVGDLK